MIRTGRSQCVCLNVSVWTRGTWRVWKWLWGCTRCDPSTPPHCVRRCAVSHATKDSIPALWSVPSPSIDVDTIDIIDTIDLAWMTNRLIALCSTTTSPCWRWIRPSSSHRPCPPCACPTAPLATSTPTKRPPSSDGEPSKKVRLDSRIH